MLKMDMAAEVSNLRLLLVDDNQDTVGVLAILMRRLGHEVHVAHDGPGAIAAAQSILPDAMMLDIGLPGMSGYQVAEEVRRTPKLDPCVLIAMTGYGQAEDLEKARNAGFQHHLLKPVRIDAIRDLLATIPPRGL